jgi:DNA-binding NarL/FixJ family response regulator
MIRLAIVNDYELVVAGIATMLSGERHRIQVTAFGPAEDGPSNVDVVLYDSFGPVDDPMVRLDELIARSRVPVVVYSWKLNERAVRRALERGAAGYLSEALGGAEIAGAVQAIARGEIVVSPDPRAGALVAGDWPGRQEGLSAREAEVLTMIAAGFDNQEIAELSYLSINTIKTYIRTGYRKIDVRNRAQAVQWAFENGFAARPGTTASTDDHGGGRASLSPSG